MIKKYWNNNPNQILRSAITDLIVKNKLDNMDFINQVIKNNSNDDESKKLFIFFSIRNKNWETAREKILGLIGSNPSKEVCIFMSDIELGENGDKQKSDAWIMRAQNATADHIWICKISNQLFIKV